MPAALKCATTGSPRLKPFCMTIASTERRPALPGAGANDSVPAAPLAAPIRCRPSDVFSANWTVVPATRPVTV